MRHFVGRILIVTALVIVISGVVAYLAFRQPDPLAEARQSGDPSRLMQCMAVIEAIRDTGSRHNHNPVLELQLSGALPDGTVQRWVLRKLAPPAGTPPLVPGQVWPVEYDRLHPDRAELLERKPGARP